MPETYDTIDAINKYPVIMKPDLCSGVGKNVKLIKSREEAEQYILHSKDAIIIQELITSKHEAGILLEREFTGKRRWRVIQITERIFPNDANYEKRIWNVDNYNNNKYENITSMYCWDAISNVMTKILPNQNITCIRLDVKFETYEELRDGRFTILEVNGHMGYDLNAWLHKSFIESFNCHIRWALVRMVHGFLNIVCGRINVFSFIKRLPHMLSNAKECNDFEKLFEYNTF